MPFVGHSQAITVAGGAASPAYCIVDTDDDDPRPGDVRHFYAYVYDAGGARVAEPGVTVHWTLYKNASVSSGAGATLSASTSTTNDYGIATVSVTYDGSAASSDVFQVRGAL